MASVPKDAEVRSAELDFVVAGGAVPSAAAELSFAQHLQSKQNQGISLTPLSTINKKNMEINPAQETPGD